jgi:hypothetical protein
MRRKNRRPPLKEGDMVSVEAMRLSNEPFDASGLSRVESTVVPMTEYFTAIEEALRSMEGPCLFVFAERHFIGRVETTSRGPLWLSAYWDRGGRADPVRQWYLKYLVDDPKQYMRGLLTLTHCIHLIEHPDRADICSMFYGTYFDSDVNFEVDPSVVLAAVKKGTKKLIVGRPAE